LAGASSARSIRRLRLARADIVFASAAVGSRLLANLIEGNPIPGGVPGSFGGQTARYVKADPRWFSSVPVSAGPPWISDPQACDPAIFNFCGSKLPAV